MTSLRGRTALVTGGGSGLGAAIATALHDAGAEVVVVGRNGARLEQVVDRLGERARALTCDVADAASVDALREALDGTEGSILVNNAGIPGPVAALTDIDSSLKSDATSGGKPSRGANLRSSPRRHREILLRIAAAGSPGASVPLW